MIRRFVKAFPLLSTAPKFKKGVIMKNKPQTKKELVADVMRNYIGAKIIQARPMAVGPFNQLWLKGGVYSRQPLPMSDDSPGYLVIYPDGYKSWSPKEVFETAYREITKDETNMIVGS